MNDSRIKKIGLSEFEVLVNDRLANPAAYAGRTLVLWNTFDNGNGIAYRVIQQCCKRYNAKNDERQVWVNMLDIFFFWRNDYSSPEALCIEKGMCGYKKHGVLFHTGACGYEKTEFLHFVNTHENECGPLSNEWPLIACAQSDCYKFEEDMFGDNCDLYCFQPSVDEWAQWISPSFDERVFLPILAYIKETRAFVPHEDYPIWELLIEEIQHEFVSNNFDSLNQIPKEDFLGKGLSIDTHDLYDFIQNLS